MTQAEAITILKTGANVFLTGEPGSGKTHTINQYISYLRRHGVEPAITASTGIAATHVGGLTIHSWSGVGVRTYMTPYDLDQIGTNKSVYERVRCASVLIIDEVSMLSNTLLTMVDQVCRELRKSEKPFGGLQVILVGDFFQLPPVTSRERNTETEVEASAPFAFNAHVWVESNFLVCYLSEQHRQEDETFLELLTAIRRGVVEEAHVAILRGRAVMQEDRAATALYAHNADVDRINTLTLEKIDSTQRSFIMSTRGPEKLVASLKRGCLSPENLFLKEGAKVMFTKNDVMRRYVNGTLGVVVGFAQAQGYPMIKTHKGAVITVEPVEWTIQDSGRVLAKIVQMPLRLAWAITVHKSQGMSMDSAHIDLSGAFEYGQGYVALSRVRTLKGLSLKGFNARALEVHPEVQSKDSEFREQSDAVSEAFDKLPKEDVTKMHHNFLRACGGSIEEKEQAVSRSVLNDKKISISTHEVTRDLVLEKKSLKEVAKARGLTEGTILGHIEELVEKGLTTREELYCVVDGNVARIKAVHEVFREVGHTPLRPVFDKLDGKVPYEIIRLARLVFVE